MASQIQQQRAAKLIFRYCFCGNTRDCLVIRFNMTRSSKSYIGHFYIFTHKKFSFFFSVFSSFVCKYINTQAFLAFEMQYLRRGKQGTVHNDIRLVIFMKIVQSHQIYPFIYFFHCEKYPAGLALDRGQTFLVHGSADLVRWPMKG